MPRLRQLDHAALAFDILRHTVDLVDRDECRRVGGELTIESVAGFEDAAGQLKAIKGLEKELESERKSITRPIDEGKKGVMDFFREPEATLKSSESTIKLAMTAWNREQERKRRAEEARLQEIQRREQEKLRRAAERADKSGKEEKAEALREEAETVSTPIVSPTTPKVTGISTRQTWKANVVDKPGRPMSSTN